MQELVITIAACASCCSISYPFMHLSSPHMPIGHHLAVYLNLREPSMLREPSIMSHCHCHVACFSHPTHTWPTGCAQHILSFSLLHIRCRIGPATLQSHTMRVLHAGCCHPAHMFDLGLVIHPSTQLLTGVEAAAWRVAVLERASERLQKVLASYAAELQLSYMHVCD